MTAYNIPNDHFAAKDALSYKNKLANYTTRCCMFSISCVHVYVSVKIAIVRYKFAAKKQKKMDHN